MMDGGRDGEGFENPNPGPTPLLISNLRGWNVMVPFSGMGWQRRERRSALKFEVPSRAQGLYQGDYWTIPHGILGGVRAGL